ncbi:hypothetical protein ACLESD_41475 [Pyxidicoccus sp. 3LFB2]
MNGRRWPPMLLALALSAMPLGCTADEQPQAPAPSTRPRQRRART